MLPSLLLGCQILVQVATSTYWRGLIKKSDLYFPDQKSIKGIAVPSRCWHPPFFAKDQMEFDFTVDANLPAKARWCQRDEELFVLRDMPAYALRPKSGYPLGTYITGYLKASKQRRKFNWPNANPQRLRTLAAWILKNPPILKMRAGKISIHYPVNPPEESTNIFICVSSRFDEPHAC